MDESLWWTFLALASRIARAAANRSNIPQPRAAVAVALGERGDQGVLLSSSARCIFKGCVCCLDTHISSQHHYAKIYFVTDRTVSAVAVNAQSYHSMP